MFRSGRLPGFAKLSAPFHATERCNRHCSSLCNVPWPLPQALPTLAGAETAPALAAVATGHSCCCQGHRTLQLLLLLLLLLEAQTMPGSLQLLLPERQKAPGSQQPLRETT